MLDALDCMSESERSDGQSLPRSLAERLHSRGLNVHLEQSTNSHGSSSELSHCFLSVLPPGGLDEERVLVEPAFKAHFRLGRATAPYEQLLAELPEHLSATEDRFRSLVEFLCKRLASSFAETGMEIPPWRRTHAMLSKWRIGERSAPASRRSGHHKGGKEPKMAEVAGAEKPAPATNLTHNARIQNADLVSGVRS